MTMTIVVMGSGVNDNTHNDRVCLQPHAIGIGRWRPELATGARYRSSLRSRPEFPTGVPDRSSPWPCLLLGCEKKCMANHTQVGSDIFAWGEIIERVDGEDKSGWLEETWDGM